jgi:glyoxylase-like metal-dependent hydrolase (beta-lactamase superfamily II)
MRVHHLNCATMCPRFGRLVNEQRRMVCHCLLLETEGGLVLVDTGLGSEDVARPRERLTGMLLTVARPRLDPEETAAHQVEELGFRRSDVRHIVLTHLDIDHAGGLPDFPEAAVHVFAAEHDAAMAPKSFLERHRYRAVQWAHGPRWVRYEVNGEPWFGFECVRQLDGLPPEILLVPLFGHTRGHCAVAVQRSEGWLLHAGDAYFFHREMDFENPRCTAGLRIFQRTMEMDRAARLHNQDRLRALARTERGVRVFCAHDPTELEAMQARESSERPPVPSHIYLPT